MVEQAFQDFERLLIERLAVTGRQVTNSGDMGVSIGSKCCVVVICIGDEECSLLSPVFDPSILHGRVMSATATVAT